MPKVKVIVTDVSYGNQNIQELTQQMIELLILNRYNLPKPIQPSHTESPCGGKEL